MPPLTLGGFRWSKTAGRYIDARGRFVSLDNVRRALDKALDVNRRTISNLSTSLQSGSISLEQWRAQMRMAIKDAHLYSAAAARGGWAQMTSRDLGRVGQRVRYNYGRLERFAGQIARGEVVLDGRFVVRAGLYAGNARATYHRVEIDTQREAGYDEERNVLRPADHCGECVALTRAGWVPLGTTKPIGERECLGNCQCGMIYRKSRERRSSGDETPAGKTELQLREELDALRRKPIGTKPGAIAERNRAILNLENQIGAAVRAQRAPAPTPRQDAPAELATTLRATVEKTEAAILAQKREVGYAFDSAGNVLISKTGTRTRITFYGDELLKLKGAAVYTHNHPTGVPLSLEDFMFANDLNIHRLRAVARDAGNGQRVLYELTRVDPNFDLATMPGYVADLNAALNRASLTRETNRRLPPPQTKEAIGRVWVDIIHERLTAFANKYPQIRYTRTEL